jgi:hypothetical protein
VSSWASLPGRKKWLLAMNMARPVEENSQKTEDAVRKLQRIRKGLARARGSLTPEALVDDEVSLSKRLADIVDEMKLWDTCLEEVRAELAGLIAERDSWRIAHDKLRERLDRHSLEPRTDPDRPPPQSARQPAMVRPRPSGESQDFSAIDAELARLNESMLRAFSSE